MEWKEQGEGVRERERERETGAGWWVVEIVGRRERMNK